MEIFFMILLAIMLIFVGYAKAQQGVAKTPGSISMNEDEDRG